MKCRQCEETKAETGCMKGGMCGKTAETAELQDLLLLSLSRLSKQVAQKSCAEEVLERIDAHITESLFSTLTNVNFDSDYFVRKIKTSIGFITSINGEHSCDLTRADGSVEGYLKLAPKAGIERLDDDDDLRSLKELTLYGLKGLAAYYYHALNLGYRDKTISEFMRKALIDIRSARTSDELIALVLQCGKIGVSCMVLLDRANTETYGKPEVTCVSTGVNSRPGILITGHDLKDLEMLLEQTEGTGVDVYTHGEMLPANAYPFFKKYKNLVGNYGNAWYRQKEEFETFNGPIVVTTNCLVPPKESYASRLFTTELVGFKGIKHIPDVNGYKDFSEVIKVAKKSVPPTEIDDLKLTIGYAHDSVVSQIDAIINAVKMGRIKRLVVMAGCDGREKGRVYYSDFAQALPKDTMIITAGCAKYRYNKMDLGEIDGIPRVLDSGQCNDCYSIIVIATELAKATGLGINDLPLSFNIAWYEQKACLVLLALLSLGVKDIMLGPRLPEFITPSVLKVLVDNFGLKGNTEILNDMKVLNIE